MSNKCLTNYTETWSAVEVGQNVGLITVKHSQWLNWAKMRNNCIPGPHEILQNVLGPLSHGFPITCQASLIEFLEPHKIYT